ncbi:MAG: PAS domain S-box protein [Methanospirillum sp.]
MSDRPVEEPDFRRLFESGPGLYMVLDPDLFIVAASDAYLAATLTSRDEIVGKYVFEVFPDNPDDPSADPVVNRSLASFRRVLQTGETDIMGLQRYDVRRPASEGGGFEVRYWSAINSPIPGPDGSVACILHRVENVTEFVLEKQRGNEQALLADALRDRAARMEADLYARSREAAAETNRQLKELNETLEARVAERTRSLRESEAKYRMLHESLRDAFVMTAMDGPIIECNDIYCALLGYSAEEIRTLTYRDLTPERWHACEDAIVRNQILPRGYSDVYEKEYRRKDGTVVPVELRTVLSRDEEGRPVAMWATVRDISERKRAEAALAETARKAELRAGELDAALASMATGIILYDAAGGIARMNGAAQRMLGIDRDALDRTDYSERRARLGITRPDGTPRAEETAAHYRALRGETVQGEEVVFTGVGAEPLHVVASAAPILDSEGGIAGAIAVFTDIADRKRAEAALRESEEK